MGMTSAAPSLAAGEVAVARVRARAGQWMIVHGAPPLSEGTRRVAVIIERGDPDRLAPLLMAAYGLTDREKDVTHLVLQRPGLGFYGFSWRRGCRAGARTAAPGGVRP